MANGEAERVTPMITKLLLAGETGSAIMLTSLSLTSDRRFPLVDS